MPTERFKRLPEEKKEAIRDAAIKEFIRVPYDKASINKMIRSAEISRGSFYTYFEDKAEVLSFILQDVRKRGRALALETLKENQGDIWVMLQELLNQGIRYCSDHDVYKFHRNIIMCPELEEIIRRECEGEEEGGCYAWVYNDVDRSWFRKQDAEALEDVLSISMGILGESIGQFSRNRMQVEQIKETFLRRIEIIKRGACKED